MERVAMYEIFNSLIKKLRTLLNAEVTLHASWNL